MMRFGFSLSFALLAGCLSGDPPIADIIPPIVVESWPSGEQVGIDATMGVRFSEPMNLGEAPEERVVVVLADRVDEAFLKGLDSPPLSSRQRGLLVAATYDLVPAGDAITMTPTAALDANQSYKILVSASVTDSAGNPLVDLMGIDERGRAAGLRSRYIHDFRTKALADDPQDPTDPQPPIDQPGESPQVVFSEIFANPAGNESQGEYAEIINLGNTVVVLTGWTVDDESTTAGDVLQPCAADGLAELNSNAIALVVGKDFVPPADLAPGTLLLCGPRSTLTSRGLKNSEGENLVLRDARGLEVSRYGGWFDMTSHEGCSVVRSELWAADSQDNWILSSSEPCRTPGWVP